MRDDREFGAAAHECEQTRREPRLDHITVYSAGLSDPEKLVKTADITAEMQDPHLALPGLLLSFPRCLGTKRGTLLDWAIRRIDQQLVIFHDVGPRNQGFVSNPGIFLGSQSYFGAHGPHKQRAIIHTQSFSNSGNTVARTRKRPHHVLGKIQVNHPELEHALDVARLPHHKGESVFQSVSSVAHRCPREINL